MSGFAGIVNLDGAPVDPALIERLTRALEFRGPDALRTWCEGPVGLGHSLLRTTRESAAERQPGALDGRLRIVADARIDDRAGLIEKLRAKSGREHEISLATPDPELILHAFDAWGDACADHLLGDFSFAIWDAPKRRLFCARDHFGIKAFYYARIGHALIFSNTLHALRLYPGFCSDLCDVAIADFLIFGANLHPTRTPFEQILRIPRAHVLVASADEIQAKRYWSFPIEEPLRYRRSEQYVEQFRELLRLAVKDRLRCDRASVSLSGGLDSPTVAAETVEQLGVPENVLGITAGFKSIIPDPEPPLARIVAEYLKIPWHFIAIDDYKPFQRWDSPAMCYSTPADLTLAAMDSDFMDRAADHGRVWLTGEGGDIGLAPSLGCYRGFGAFRLILGVAKYMLTHGRHPRIGFRASWRRWRGMPDLLRPSYPAWLAADLDGRLGLNNRWNEIMDSRSPVHPYRPDAYRFINGPWFVDYTTHDWCRRNVHVELRHPLLDVRLQRFYLRLRVLPWCADKEILRTAMRDRLPEDTLRRPKATVLGNPLAAMLRETAPGASRDFLAAPQLHRYVAQDRIPNLGGPGKATNPEIDLRPINLNYWLSQNLR